MALSLILAFAMSFIINVLLIVLSKRFDMFIDSASSLKPQKFHTHHTPRSGGIGIFLSFVICGSFYFVDSAYFVLFIAILSGGIIIFCSGVIEDFNGSISPKIRLILQCIGVFLSIMLSNVYLLDLSLGFEMPYIVGVLFSVFAVVGVINAFNIIDGFNGLASGVAILILCAIAFISYENSFIFYICLLLIAGLLGFFVLNFPKGAIFLGDGGAYFLGFIIGFLLMYVTQDLNKLNLICENSLVCKWLFSLLDNFMNLSREVTHISLDSRPSAWFGVAISIYPIFEVLFSMFRKKILLKTKAMQPDNFHFHMLVFRILAKNNNAKTSIYILIFNLPFLLFCVLNPTNTDLLLCMIFVFSIAYILLYRYMLKCDTSGI